MTFLSTMGVLLASYFAFVWWATFLRGPFRFTYHPVVARFLPKGAWTFGARAYLKNAADLADFAPGGFEPLHLPYDHPVRQWFRHEKQHNHQFRVRPFMAPVYVFWDTVVGYWRNPLEKEAERAED